MLSVTKQSGLTAQSGSDAEYGNIPPDMPDRAVCPTKHRDLFFLTSHFATSAQVICILELPQFWIVSDGHNNDENIDYHVMTKMYFIIQVSKY